MKSKLRKVLQGIMILWLCLGFTAVLIEPVSAATCTWTGSVSKAWTAAGNWSCGHVPNSADDVIIANVGTQNPLITTSIDAQIFTLTINSGGILEATGSGRLNLVVQGQAVTNNGAIKTTGTIESAAITLYSSEFYNNGVIDINAGTFNAYTDSGGTQTGSFSGQYGAINMHGVADGLLTFNSGSVINVKRIFFDNIPTVNIYGTVNQYWPSSSFNIYHSNVHLYITTPPTVGETSITGGELHYIMAGPITGSIAVPLGTKLTGEGAILGNLDNAGTVSPGASPGVIAVEGAYTQESTGELEIELDGTDPGIGYDQLAVTGLATLGGTLKVSLVDPFNPALGQNFTIMTYGSHTGEFGSVNLPALDPGLGWQITDGASSVILSVIEAGGSISGAVTCAGIYSGSTETLFVDMWTDIQNPPPEASQQIACGDSYIFDELGDGAYYIGAWLDLDGSGGGPPGTGEPHIWYGAPDAILISGGDIITGIDITIENYLIFLPLTKR